MRAIVAVLSLIVSIAATAGEWASGDGVRYLTGCHTAAGMRAVLDAWAAGKPVPPEAGEDCFRASRPLPAVLIDQIPGAWTMPDGTRVEMWRVLDAMGDTEHTYLPIGDGPHNGA